MMGKDVEVANFREGGGDSQQGSKNSTRAKSRHPANCREINCRETGREHGEEKKETRG